MYFLLSLRYIFLMTWFFGSLEMVLVLRFVTRQIIRFLNESLQRQGMRNT